MNMWNKVIGTGAVLGLGGSLLFGSTGTQAGVRPAGHAVIPLSVSFISGSRGWMLAVPGCARHGCRKLLMRTTTDGGLRWARLPAPPARLSAFPSTGFGPVPTGRSGAVNTVLFANASDGWIYGPGLLATHDGGRTWHRINTHGLLVTRMGTGHGHVFAVFRVRRCHTTAGVCPSHLLAARVGSDSFHRLRGTAYADGRASTVVTSRGRAYVGAFFGYRFRHGVGVPRQALLTGRADGKGRWHRMKLPGRRGQCGQFGMFLAAAGRRLAVACAGQPGGLPPVPMQHKWIYLSGSRGRTWQRVTSPPTIAGYMTSFCIAQGIMAESGDRANVHFSWDGGHTWHISPSLAHPYQATSSAGLAGTMVTSHFGFVLVGSRYLPRIYLTYDAGHTWVPRTVH